MAYPDDLGPTDGWVYHYTSTPTALEHIVQEMKLRLGPVHDTNDPWEARMHRLWVSDVPRGYPEGPSVRGAAHEELERALKRTRVACFSRDEPDGLDVERARRFARSTRGWARDRMWAQYADGHRGVCLCFDREKLLESLRVLAAEHGDSFHGDVEYGDEQFEKGGPIPSLDEAESLGPVKYALRFRKRTAAHRYLKKRKDWRDEREWRLILFDDNPTGAHAFVPIEHALRAVIVGHRFADAYQPVVKAACERLGLPAFKLLYSGHVALSSGRYDQRVVGTV